ncbi:MAG: hypothetical protein H0T53_04465 [Herpetosiphonaceae bacterium]|nr:hypothetical protein [Herpetosiphonaceae bacterium]
MLTTVKDHMNQKMLEARTYRLVHSNEPVEAPEQPRRNLWSYVFFWRHSGSHA